MKRILYFTILALGVLSACTTDKVLYDFEENPGVGATFAASSLAIPDLVAEDGGKLSIPLYRANTKGNASVEVLIEGGEGVFTPAKNAVDFADGSNVAYLEFSYDYASLSAKPVSMVIYIKNEADVAFDGIASTSVSLVKRLTYSSVGEGYYTSYFFGQGWPQEVLKAEEGPYYSLPSCWVNGVDLNFFFDGTDFELYTVNPGYNYGSYGPVCLEVLDYEVVQEEGSTILTIYVNYVLPNLDNYILGQAMEEIAFPAGI